MVVAGVVGVVSVGDGLVSVGVVLVGVGVGLVVGVVVGLGVVSVGVGVGVSSGGACWVSSQAPATIAASITIISPTAAALDIADFNVPILFPPEFLVSRAS